MDLNREDEIHCRMVWPTLKLAKEIALQWPRAYEVECLGGWTLFRTQCIDPEDLPPKLTVACICGDFH